MPFIGDIYINMIEKDEHSHSVKVTDHPIESGESIADHVQRQPFSMSASGIITGKDANARMQKLKTYMEKGTLVLYRNRISVSGILITDFKPVHDGTDRDGFRFSISFRTVKIAKSSLEKEMKLPKRAKVKKKETKGTKQKKKSSDIKKNNKSKKKKKDQTSAVKSKVGGLTPAQAAAQNGNRVYGK